LSRGYQEGERRLPSSTMQDIDSIRDSNDKKLLPDLSQQSSAPNFIYGIWLGRGLYSNLELDRAFRVAKNLGVKYFKVEFKWAFIEPRNDKWQWDNEGTIDVEYVISLAKRYNFSIIPYFNIFMPWGEKKHVNPNRGECDGLPSRWGQHQAPDPQEYAEYVFSVIEKIKRNGVDVSYIELDNEDSVMNDGYRLWNCYINITAKQLKIVENAAYEKVKQRYPDVKISSTTFNSPGMDSMVDNDIFNKFTYRLNNFIEVYFGEDPRPKFDFLALHEIFSGSGNPYTTLEKQKAADYTYNFSSYHDTYEIWRDILDRYGYTGIPIFTTESAAKLKGKQDAELIQKVVFARTNAYKNNVIGWILSQLTGSKKFTEGKRRNLATVGIIDITQDYEFREGYYAFYALMTTLAKYPIYEKRLMGELNSQQPWVEKFSDSAGNVLLVAFIPCLFGHDTHQTLSLQVGSNKDVILKKSNSTMTRMRSDRNGYVTFTVTQHPIFIEINQ